MTSFNSPVDEVRVDAEESNLQFWLGVRRS